MIIKVCGLRDSENIRQVIELGVDWVGMVFCEKSPRNVTMIPTHAGIIPDRGSLSTITHGHSPLRVGVFVDEMAQNMITRVVNYQLDFIQLNGYEPPTLIRNLRSTLIPDIRPNIRFIKTISVRSREDVAAFKKYEDCVDFFLFDIQESAVENSSPLDWNILDAYDGQTPFLLGGGIGPNDAERVRRFHHPHCVGIDLNTCFEASPGMIDIEKLKTFLHNTEQG